MAKQLLKLREVCELLNVERHAIWRWEKRGDFPAAIGIGTGRRMKRWRREDVEKYIADGLKGAK